VDGFSRLTEIEAYAPAEAGSANTMHWLVTDHLGTPRMVFDQTGELSNVKRHDYLPFGEELFAPTGGRSAAQGYAGSDGVRQQFTRQERDIETGLDYFLARYYSNVQGRFTSTDPLMASASISDPQSFNRYVYVRNSPLVSIDPNGMDDCQINKTCSFTTEDWATNGAHPEQAQIREQVTFYIPPAAPITTTSVDVNSVSLNLKDLNQPVLLNASGTAGGNSSTPAEPSGYGFSMGGTLGVNIGAGLGFAGAGATGGGFVGLFSDLSTGNATAGAGLEGGAEAYILSGDRAVTPRLIASAVGINDDEPAVVFGAGAGGGGGFWVSNASRPEDLRGPFVTRQLNTPWVGIQVDTSGRVRVLSITFGPQQGALYWVGKTSTITTPAVPVLTVK